MELKNDCMYCMKNETLKGLMIEVCKLSVSTLYMFKEQTYKGRCIVAYDGHETELFRLNKEEMAAFMSDVSKAGNAIFKAFRPGKLNYGAYGDKCPHLHMHLVPKYDGGPDWGSTFEMNPGKTYLSDDEYKNLIDLIKANM